MKKELYSMATVEYAHMISQLSRRELRYFLAKVKNEQTECRRLRRELDCAKNGDPTVGKNGD